MKCDKRSQADYYVRAIRYALEEDDPLAWWELKSQALEGKEGGYGVWIKYRGRMSPEQVLEREANRRKAQDRMQKAYAKKALREAQRLRPDVRPFPGTR